MASDEPTTEHDAVAVAHLIGRGAAEAMRSENFEALRAWVEREIAVALPGLPAQAASETGRRAGTNAIATTIWNAAPLPSNGFRPRLRPTPGRNDPCACGSGQKFKRCCCGVSSGLPILAEDDAWHLLVTHLSRNELQRWVEDASLPPGPLALLAQELHERGGSDAARTALSGRLARVESLDDRHEPALDVFLELEAGALPMSEFVERGRALAARLPRRLQATVYRHLVPAAITAREIDAALELLDRIRSATPDEPSLGPLEVTTLLAAGQNVRASERARFWISWLRRRGLAEEMPDALEMLEQAARDPEAAASAFRALEAPFLDELAQLVARAASQPAQPYRVELVAGDARFATAPEAVRRAELEWRRVWRSVKPGLVSLDAELPESVVRKPEKWLKVLRRHPEALSSLEVLDDLVLLAGPAAEDLDPGWDRSLLAPLLERAAASVRESLAPLGGHVRLPWGFWENRPALRLLSRLGYRLDGAGRSEEAALVYEEILRLNPHDNHGHRAWLVNHYLRRGVPERALEIANQYPDDALPDVVFGRGLALWRLGRRSQAEQALRLAATDRPLLLEALLAPELPQPRLTPGRVTLGGKDEAWLYREEMLEAWKPTPGALEFLRTLVVQSPRRRRPSRR